jgi:HD-GYP domain-containing protein (c-di-GMP phosphodiesterase class II)
MVKFSDIFNDPGRRRDDQPKGGGMDFSSLFNTRGGVIGPRSSAVPESGSLSGRSSENNGGFSAGEELEMSLPVRGLYDDVCQFVGRLFEENRIIRGEDFDVGRALTDEALACLGQSSGQLLACVFDRSRERNEDFYIRNAVNVFILSLETALELKYSEDRIRRLGVAALLHEVGMREYRELMCKARAWTPAEHEEIRGHASAGASLVEKADDDYAAETARVLLQEHERVDGTGYPYGLREHMIHEDALIIGMVDVYEALTHGRPYRSAVCPLEAMKILIEGERRFAVKPLKAFLERVGLYPCGTRVELNTREVAVVIGQNLKMPSCPVVRVVYNGRGERSEPQRQVDLSKGTRIYIVKSL